MDKNKILHYAYEKISQDTKLIRLATVTTFIHSLIFIFIIMYRGYSFVTKLEWGEVDISQFASYLQYMMIDIKTYIAPIIIIWIILAIWYLLLPPIADATLIFYVNDEKKKWKSSLMKWIMRFFPMFENHWLFSFFNFFIFIIACLRFYIMGVEDFTSYGIMNIFILTILIIRFLVIVGVTIFLPYTKFFIVLQNKSVRDAIRDSINLAVENIGITFKFVLIGYILYLRFFINIILVLWLPALAIYLTVWFGYDQNDTIKDIIYWIFIAMILFSAYINWIIEAFFMTYWYKVFAILTWMEILEEETGEWNESISQEAENTQIENNLTEEEVINETENQEQQTNIMNKSPDGNLEEITATDEDLDTYEISKNSDDINLWEYDDSIKNAN